ncbi:hypothetical protein E2C01_096008 [Portunus trituberculatus]|uniref:Uncharacterized protein n=1 Tax=Portunus trituberculatus TaxID=210409 RepID=A0A5B7JRI6_PORTR|nr:hypothetical protein [Portunus trituberculatus]
MTLSSGISQTGRQEGPQLTKCTHVVATSGCKASINTGACVGTPLARLRSWGGREVYLPDAPSLSLSSASRVRA